jgi:hypothetical protein
MTGDWRLSHAAAGNLNGPIHDDSTVCVRVLAADTSKYVRTANSPRGVSVVARAHAGRMVPLLLSFRIQRHPENDPVGVL